MKVVVALDSFKGSITSAAACNAVLKGCKRAYEACTDDFSNFQGVALPVSDGGEGLIQCLSPTLLSQGYHKVSCHVRPPFIEQDSCDPSLPPPQTKVNMLIRGHECIIESAQSLGLALIPEEDRNILRTSSYSLGEQINYALNNGCNMIKIGLGGTCSNDCGLGMAQALGVKFYGSFSKGNHGILTTEDLGNVIGFDASALEQRLQRMHVRVIGLTDVTNPLLGPQGASYVFAPQKGATSDMLPLLEYNMQSFYNVLSHYYREELDIEEGSGAAGGLGAAILYYLNGNLCSGIDALLDMVNFPRLMEDCDLLIVGEGCLDKQSLAGKAPVGLAERAAELGVPVIALCGKVEFAADDPELISHHICRAYGIVNDGVDTRKSKLNAAKYLEELAERHLKNFFYESHDIKNFLLHLDYDNDF